MKTRVIFASLILGLGLVANQATAATTITDDSPAAKKPASALLAAGTQKQFASYVEQHFSRFSRKGDWQNFASVVSVYNENPVSVLALNADDRSKFNESASAVIKKLARENSTEASAWQDQTNSTIGLINFLWNIQENQPQLPDNQ